MTNDSKKKLVRKSFQLERKFPDDLQSHFVSNIVVQHTPEHFTLSFFEVWPPPIVADSVEERQKILNSIEKIEAKCVARLVVTPDKMREFVDVMKENLDNYDKMIKGLEVLKQEGNHDE